MAVDDLFTERLLSLGFLRVELSGVWINGCL
jgi:hypothetical protein